MATVYLKHDGRVLVPIELRRTLGASPGEALVARVEDGRLVIERRSDAIRRLQAQFDGLGAGVSLSDELMAERRAEAAQGR